MTTFAFADGSASRHPHLSLVQVNDDLWRVTRPEGDVLGYVEAFPVGDDRRYRAKRMMPRLRRLVAMGEFWSFDDSVDVFA